MRRVLVAACALFAVATGAVASYIVARDRDDTLRVVGERTASMARMIMAHGDAAADGAMQIINSIYPVLASWDLQDTGTGRSIGGRLKEMAGSSNLISSAWVVDAAGINIVDNWSYPANPVDASSRPYFQAHLKGASGPVIMGDDRPGSITGKERFTVSRAVRRPNGELKAVIVVGIYKSIFDTLYKEAVNWPGARAGLYTLSGDALARIQSQQRATPAFITEILSRVKSAPNGTILVNDVEPEARIVSWQRSENHSQLFATASQPVSDALDKWEGRAIATALLAAAANILFWLLAYYIFRSVKVRQEAEANELAVREVNHRVNNSLQLISSLLQLRARKTEAPHYRSLVRDVTSQLVALAETYRFVQSATKLGTVDAARSVEALCGHLMETYGMQIAVDAPLPTIVHANHASALSVIVNELVTNAMKHGGEPVKVSLSEDKDMMWIAVAAPRGRLPEGFTLEDAQGFGLRAVRSMLSGLNGHMSARNLPDGGTVFTVSIPVAALVQP